MFTLLLSLDHKPITASPKSEASDQNDNEAQQQGETFDNRVDTMKFVVIGFVACLGLFFICVCGFIHYISTLQEKLSALQLQLRIQYDSNLHNGKFCANYGPLDQTDIYLDRNLCVKGL